MTIPNISILLPTRGRTTMLSDSINSLIEHADSPEKLEWLLAFDRDDIDSFSYFNNNILPGIQETGAKYKCLAYDPLGYGRLHDYLNNLAKHATANWFVFWNDDAVMIDDHWDTEITSRGDKFCIQAFNTHNMHPYSIFPIVPRAWYDELGHLSVHPLNDAYISQIAWMLDIMERIDIKVEHRRFDLTGENRDKTYADRVIFEGNVADPRDLNHESHRKARFDNAKKLSKYMQSKGLDTSLFEQIVAGKLDPWAKMLASDVNKQMVKISMK
jgi:hypothetical protein